MSASEKKGYFKVRFPASCAHCRKKLEEGDWAIYDEDKQLVCRPCHEDDPR